MTTPATTQPTTQAPVSTRLHLTTAELHAGDVVLHHGMHLVIDQPIETYTNRSSVVYATSALVTNLEEVRADKIVSISWLHEKVWNAARGWHVPEDQEPRWRIQGNHLARWTVERPSRLTSDGLPVVAQPVCSAGCCDVACHTALCRPCCGQCVDLALTRLAAGAAGA